MPSMDKPSSKKLILLAAVLFFLGVAGTVAFSFTLEATNTVEFCTSCHTMDIPLQELQKSPHWNNPSGVRVGCADCHVPHEIGPKLWAKIRAAKDVFFQITGKIDTPELYEQHRWDMANVVWAKMAATDSRECRNCHSFDAMLLDEQDKSAAKKHARAKEEGKTCIECHKGIAHKKPTDPNPPAASAPAPASTPTPAATPAPAAPAPAAPQPTESKTPS